MKFIDHLQKVKTYMFFVIVVGAAVLLLSAYSLPVERLDLRFMLLASLTVLVSSRFAVLLPRFNTSITLSDTLIFLSMLLYGGDATVLLAAAEGASSGLRLSRKPRTVLFNAAAMACATFVTAKVLQILFGDTPLVAHQPLSLAISALCTMALVQYLTHTGLISICLAYKSEQPIWQTWHNHYLWSSLTYFAGAPAAGLIVVYDTRVGFYSLIVLLPIILILYLTYHQFVENIKASARQAELLEHERAEAESKRAEQAERHVEELSHYIEELERASSALRENKEHFRHAALHDSLTGLPNRVLFTDHLRLAIEQAKRRKDYSFAVLFLDLDRFKNINDSLGHTYGDQMLRQIAHRLEGCLRQVDTVARFGGDEFAVLLDGIAEASDAVRVAEKIQLELLAPFNLDQHEAFTTASIGIAHSSVSYERSEDILRDADTAMYRAKDGGKARHEVFDKVMHARAMSLLKLESDLRRAIEQQEFRVYYQPIIVISTGKLSGFEALVRWQHPERGLVSPAEFIPVAEETGLIVAIGQWVLEEACRQMREWHNESPINRALIMSVNLSSKQLAQPDLVEQVAHILAQTKFDSHHLKLELTESSVMENAETAATMLKQLRALGLQLSIDDFGTGYSSLSYLHRFPLDTLKIDRSFINLIGLGDENTEIVRTIIALARNLGMSVVAEGIESEQQLAHLKTLECEYGQGFLFSKPMDAEAAGNWIRNGHQRHASAHLSDAPQQPNSLEPLNSTLVM